VAASVSTYDINFLLNNPAAPGHREPLLATLVRSQVTLPGGCELFIPGQLLFI
jgi:hypothetical protein